jgi:probable F420-dependent oxidoreductase
VSGSADPPRFALDLPQRGDAGLVARVAARAEELGYDGLWAMDNVLPAQRQLAPLPLLAFAAAHTSRIRLGIAVFVLPHYNPALLARELAALDHLCSGRLDVGVGLGRRQPDLVGLGYPDDRPLRRLSEGIGVLRALWSEERASFDGEVWRFQDRAMEPKPLQQPHPPIWLGVGGPQGLRVAARLGDAWIGAGSSSSEQFLERAALLRAELHEAGRDPDSFPVAKRVYLAVGPSLEQARAALAPVLDGMYGAPGLTERVAVYGPPEHCAEQLRALVEGGARLLVLNPAHDPEGQLDAVTELTLKLAR